ncbi:MAG: hypothetical protein ACPL1Y_00880 [Thermoplasmata archaeon]
MPYTAEEVKKYLGEIEDLLTESRKVNGDISAVDKLLIEAKKLFEKGELEETVTYLNEAKERLNEIYAQGAKEQLSFLRAITSAIKNTGVDPKELREYLRNTRAYFENKDYIMAYKTASEGMNFATQLIQKDPVLKQSIYKSRQKFGLSEGLLQKLEKMEGTQSAPIEIPERTEKAYLLDTKLKLAKNAGIDISGLDEELKALENALDACDEKISRLLNEHVRKKLDNYKMKIEEFRKDGIEIGKIEENLAELEKKMDELSFEEIFAEIKNFDETVNHPNLYITALRKKIEVLRELGEEAKEFDTALGQAELFRTDGNLASASAIARETVLKISEKITSKLKEKIENMESLRQYANQSKLKGFEEVECRSIIDAYKEGNFLECAKNLKEFNIKVENVFKEHIKDKISALNVRMNVARNMGVPLLGIENMLQSVREQISAKNYLEAIKIIENMESRCEADMKKYRTVNDLMTELDKKIQKIVNAGMDPKDLQSKFSKVIELKNKDIEGAITLLTNALEEVEEILKEMKFGIDLEFTNQPAPKGSQTSAELLVKNTGNVLVKGLKIEATPPVPGLKQTLAQLKPESKEILKFNIRLDGDEITFKVSANNPISSETAIVSKNFKLAIEREKPLEKVKEPQPATAAPPPPAPKAETEKTKEEVKTFIKKNADAIYQCGFCRGKIKVGLPMVVCECGATYHEPCANRAGKCLKCGKALK